MAQLNGLEAINVEVQAAEDAFGSLLGQEYQRLQHLSASHYHECASCGVTLVCVCQDRRQVDRLTGKPRKLLCVKCGDF